MRLEFIADFFQNPEITKYQRLPISDRRQVVQSFQHHFRTNSIGIPHGQGQNRMILFGLKLIHQKTLCFKQLFLKNYVHSFRFRPSHFSIPKTRAIASRTSIPKLHLYKKSELG